MPAGRSAGSPATDPLRKDAAAAVRRAGPRFLNARQLTMFIVRLCLTPHLAIGIDSCPAAGPSTTRSGGGHWPDRHRRRAPDEVTGPQHQGSSRCCPFPGQGQRHQPGRRRIHHHGPGRTDRELALGFSRGTSCRRRAPAAAGPKRLVAAPSCPAPGTRQEPGISMSEQRGEAGIPSGSLPCALKSIRQS